MKVLVFGAKGYLGGEFLKLYPDAIASFVDIGDASAVAKELDEHQPDTVINAAGKTGRPNVDWCEDHKLETIHSNVTGPLVLLKECGDRGIYWVHLGSGCIYSGDNNGKGFSEEDPPNFFGSFYSRTKGWIDQMFKDFPDSVLVLRLRMPMDNTDQPRNLITKLIKYDKILDDKNSITYLPDFFDATAKLIEKRATGIYNMVNPESMSPYEIMLKYKEIVDPSHEFERISIENLTTVTKAGRSSCVLNTEKLKKEGIEMRTISDAVEDALAHLKTNK